MNLSEMERLIVDGQSLVTRAERSPFTLTCSDHGLVFDISTGNRRRTPWHGPKGRKYGVVELYADGIQARRLRSRAWVIRRMAETGVGTRHTSYILAAFEFFSEQSDA